MTHDAPAAAPVDPADDRKADMAQQLADAKSALAAARRELETLRVEHEELRLQHDKMRSSKAFRMAECVWALRNAAFPRAGRRR